MLHGLALTANHFGVWVSSLIVMGIMSYLISRDTAGVYYERNTHTIYEEVIVRSRLFSRLSSKLELTNSFPSQAVLTFIGYTFVILTSFFHAARSHIQPLTLVLSYLWLTSFILSVQDWAGNRCTNYSYDYGYGDSNKCNIKKTAIAFNFFTL